MIKIQFSHAIPSLKCIMLVLEITVGVFVSICLEEIMITADTILSKIKLSLFCFLSFRIKIGIICTEKQFAVTHLV